VHWPEIHARGPIILLLTVAGYQIRVRTDLGADVVYLDEPVLMPSVLLRDWTTN